MRAAYLHQPINIIHGTGGVLGQRVVGPHELAHVTVLRRVQYCQVVHIRISEIVQSILLFLQVLIKMVVKYSALDLHDVKM